jgi:hypothetical protein
MPNNTDDHIQQEPPVRTMSEFWGLAIVLFIILFAFIAIILRCSSYCSKYDGVLHQKVLLSEVEDELKSGDIIFFIAHVHGFTNSLLTKDLYSHVGMVLRTQEGLFLSESTANYPSGVDAEFYQGSQIHPFHARLANYSGSLFLMRLEHPLTEGQRRILVDRVRTQTPYPGIISALLSVVGVSNDKRERHCMQHVAWLLDEMGLTPDELADRGKKLARTGLFASSRAVSTLSGKALGKGANKYKNVVQMLYDL